MENPEQKYTHELLDQTYILMNSEEWNNELTNEDIILDSRLFEDSPLKCYRISTIVDKTVEEIFNKLWLTDEESVKRNQPAITHWKEIHKDVNWRIYELISKKIRDTKMQSIINQSKYIINDDVCILSFSVDHSNALYKPEYTHNIIYFIMYCLTPLNENQTLVRRISYIDPNNNLFSMSDINHISKLAIVDTINKLKLD
jgi:hypothetical protein